MGIFGKILLVLNLLIGGGFAYLAVQDWKGRQTITAAGLRHLVLLNGLPLGDQKGDPEKMASDPEAEIPFVIDGPGGKPTETVSPALLKAYFAQAGGDTDKGIGLASTDAVPNQLAEVRRVYDAVKAFLDAQEGGKKAQSAFNLLVLQAETLEERQAAQDLLKAGDANKLVDRLENRFKRVLDAPAPGDTSALDADIAGDPAKAKERLGKAEAVREGVAKDVAERRARLAHLLVHLDPSAAWQKRVLMVVGARRYAKTVGVQAIRLGEMAARVRRATDEAEARFVKDYATLRELATERSQLLRDRAENAARLAEIEKKDAKAVAELRTRLEDPTLGLKAQYALVKADVDKMLAKQSLTEKQLFDIQREVGVALNEIFRLEAELDRTERTRYPSSDSPVAPPPAKQ